MLHLCCVGLVYIGLCSCIVQSGRVEYGKYVSSSLLHECHPSDSIQFSSMICTGRIVQVNRMKAEGGEKAMYESNCVVVLVLVPVLT